MNNSSTSELAKKNNRKRFNKSVIIYIVSLGTGLIFGTAVALHQKEVIHLSTNLLLVTTVILTVILYLITWVWYKSMDEFEKLSFNQAGNFAFHTGFLAFPWYLLNQLGLFPPLDAIVLVFSMSVVFAVYYYGKKFI